MSIIKRKDKSTISKKRDRSKAKKTLINIGKGLAIATVFASLYYLVDKFSNDESKDFTYYCNTNNSGEDDTIYGLGYGIYPNCRTCGAKMTDFDDWAWYACPECGDKVRIIDGEETWYDDVFKKDKKEFYSDFELADFCRGGDLTED